jgi:hypothetical protein
MPPFYKTVGVGALFREGGRCQCAFLYMGAIKVMIVGCRGDEKTNKPLHLNF